MLFFFIVETICVVIVVVIVVMHDSMRGCVGAFVRLQCVTVEN